MLNCPVGPWHFCQADPVIYFFPLKCYLLTFYPFILSAVLAVRKGFLHLHIYPPHNFLRSLCTFLYESGLQGWHAKQVEAAAHQLFLQDGVLYFCWQISTKLYLKYITLKNLPLSPPPRYATFFFFAAWEFYCWIFLCVLWFPGAEAGSNTWCGRHSPLKICRFFPHKCFHEPLQGDSLWPLGAFVGTCTPFDPVPALIGL